ncbi:MAG TPA: class I SAM-dependent methyltransferase [Flavobacteriales bacterium]|nr:class I SAM-dependent methyltransferase [Flavobacteriales bacterium]
MDKVKKFWDDQATQYREQVQATQPDHYSFIREIETIIEHLQDGQEVIEYGCGNGNTMREVLKSVALKDYCGVDYSDEMIQIAKAGLNASHVRYEVGDVKEHVPHKLYDVAVTDRCLINLATHEEQIIAAKNISSTLRPNGTYLMIECSKKSLSNINEVRSTMGLSEITERWHNCYLDEDRFLQDISPYFEVTSVKSPISTYFLVSRTINAIIGDKTGTIDYFSDINEAASRLPATGDYAPLKLFILRKKEV